MRHEKCYLVHFLILRFLSTSSGASISLNFVSIKHWAYVVIFNVFQGCEVFTTGLRSSSVLRSIDSAAAGYKNFGLQYHTAYRNLDHLRSERGGSNWFWSSEGSRLACGFMCLETPFWKVTCITSITGISDSMSLFSMLSRDNIMPRRRSRDRLFFDQISTSNHSTCQNPNINVLYGVYAITVLIVIPEGRDLWPTTCFFDAAGRCVHVLGLPRFEV